MRQPEDDGVDFVVVALGVREKELRGGHGVNIKRFARAGVSGDGAGWLAGIGGEDDFPEGAGGGSGIFYDRGGRVVDVFCRVGSVELLAGRVGRERRRPDASRSDWRERTMSGPMFSR